MALPEITIIKDTREQQGWDFEEEEKKPGKIRVKGTVVNMLDAGDYSVAGYEDIVRIERKFGIRELFGNMTPVANKERFEREMEKLSKIPYKYILIESNLSMDVMGLTVPQFFKSPPCSAVMKWLLELQMEYGVVPMFVGDSGKKVARTIFETVIRRVTKDG
jgi:hypothetical protein